MPGVATSVTIEIVHPSVWRNSYRLTTTPPSPMVPAPGMPPVISAHVVTTACDGATSLRSTTTSPRCGTSWNIGRRCWKRATNWDSASAPSLSTPFVTIDDVEQSPGTGPGHTEISHEVGPYGPQVECRTIGSVLTMRSPCSACGEMKGRIEVRGGQNCVFCVGCGQWSYNAPKAETGEAIRSLSSRPRIKPKQKARILSRDGYACLCCHATDRPLVIGHLVSVHDGPGVGMTDADLNHDENLAPFCEECNAGVEPPNFRRCAG